MHPTARAALHGLALGVVACRGPTLPGSAPSPAATVNIPEEPAAPESADTEPEVVETPRSEPETNVGQTAPNCCKGMNECKGKGGCKTEVNECAGKNDCKGTGGCNAFCPR